jgi:iron complex outermembrane receptor protein
METSSFSQRPVALACLTALSALSLNALAQQPPEQLDKVIVTTTKRLTTVQDTPLAVTAIGAKDLEKAQVKDITTLQALIPNLVIEQHGDSGGIHVFLRGIGSTNHTELGDPAVAFHVDGVYAARPQGATVLMYDLASVEVARGPQGTLFGRNATAGSINVITAKPELGKTAINGQLTYGDRGRIATQAAFNLPLGESVALRLAAATDRQDGWVEFQPRSNVLPGSRKYGAMDQSGVRVSARVDFSESLSNTTTYEYFQDKGAGNVMLRQRQLAGQPRYSALIDTPGQLDQSSTQLRTRFDWQLSPALELSYIGATGSLRRTNASDDDAGIQPGFKQEHRTEWSRFQADTHELNLKSTDAGAFQWIAGLFSIKEDNRIRFDIDISQIAVPAGNGPINVVPTQPTDTAWAMSFIQPKRTLSSNAVFGQGTLNFSPEMALTLGARHTKEEKQDIGGRNWVCPNFGATLATGGRLIGPGGPVTEATCGTNLGNGQEAGVTWPGGGRNDGKIEDSATTWLARAEYKPAKDLMAYASVSSGFKSGGLSDGGRRHKPEFITSFEAGLKTELMNKALALNLAAFSMKYKDMQVSSIEFTGEGIARQQQLVTSNAARSTISGLEAEWVWRLSPATRFGGYASWLKAQYDDFLTCDSALTDCALASNVVNLKGEDLPHAPKFSTTFSLEHDFAVGAGKLTPRLQAQYKTKTKLGPFGAISSAAPAAAQQQGDGRFQKAYSTIDFSLRYEELKGRYFVEAFVVNAGDTEVRTDSAWRANGTANASFVSFYHPPRTYGLKGGFRF